MEREQHLLRWDRAVGGDLGHVGVGLVPVPLAGLGMIRKLADQTLRLRSVHAIRRSSGTRLC